MSSNSKVCTMDYGECLDSEVEEKYIIGVDLASGPDMAVNPYGEYVAKFAKAHGITIDEAHQSSMCKARFDYFNQTGR